MPWSVGCVINVTRPRIHWNICVISYQCMFHLWWKWGRYISQKFIIQLSSASVIKVNQTVHKTHFDYCAAFSFFSFFLSFLSSSFFFRKEGNVLFNDALNTFYLRLYGVTHMVKDHSDNERGNPLPPHGLLLPIAARVILYAPFHRQDNTYHSSCGALTGLKLAQWVHH